MTSNTPSPLTVRISFALAARLTAQEATASRLAGYYEDPQDRNAEEIDRAHGWAVILGGEHFTEERWEGVLDAEAEWNAWREYGEGERALSLDHAAETLAADIYLLLTGRTACTACLTKVSVDAPWEGVSSLREGGGLHWQCPVHISLGRDLAGAR